MRLAIHYYLMQTWTADQCRQAQHDAPAVAASQARHARTPERDHRVSWLPAKVARRMPWALGGSPSTAESDRPAGTPGRRPWPAVQAARLPER